MRAFESWMMSYVLNSLWQAPLIFGAAWLVIWLARGSKPVVVHRMWVGALMLEIALPGLSMPVAQAWQTLLGLAQMSHDAGTGRVLIALGAETAKASGTLRIPPVVLAGVATFYGGCMLYFIVRLAWGLWRTREMQRRAEVISLTGHAAQSCERYSRLFGVHDSCVAVTTMASGPMTVGVRRGVMLVPPSFLDAIEGGDLEAVIAHEFAHMQRHDFAKNVLYELLALPLAFHPITWLTRARVAESREMVCDGMAAEAVEGRERYARSLLRLASMVAHQKPAGTLHAIGIFDANIFERRVMQLTKRRIELSGVRRAGIAVAGVVVAMATCVSALALRVDVAAPTAQSAEPVPLTVPVGKLKNIKQKMPVYPAEAKANKDTLNGAVVLAVTIGKEGKTENIQVTKGLRADYDMSAIEAVREWTWEPYLLNGNQTEIKTTVTIKYSLRN